MSSGTILLVENWPTIRGADTEHTVFRSNRIIHDTFVSSTSANQSFRDIIADGLIITCLKQRGFGVELVVVNVDANDHSCHAFSEYVDTYVTLDNAEALYPYIENTPLSESSIRIIVLRMKTVVNTSATLKQGAANSAITQMITSRDALFAVERIYTLCVHSSEVFAMFSYQTVILQENIWCVTHQTCAILPIGMSIANPSNIGHTMTLFIQRFDIDTSDPDFIQTPMYSTTIDETDDIWACTIRAMHGNERYELVANFDPYDFDALNTMVADIGTSAETWIIQSQSSNGNLTNDADWLNSDNTTKLHDICVPILQDIVRRRSTINVSALVDNVHENYLDDSEVEVTMIPEEVPEEVYEEVPPTQSENEYILSRLIAKFGEDGNTMFPVVLHLIAQNLPYTLVLCNRKIHTFEGALSPTLIHHLASVGASIPTERDVNAKKRTMQLTARSSTLFLQNMKVNFDSMLYIRGIICYNSQKIDRFRRLGNIRRGSVKLFAAKNEQYRKHR